MLGMQSLLRLKTVECAVKFRCCNLQHLVSVRLRDCVNMEDYVNKMTKLWSKVQAVGVQLGEDVVGSLMLGGLPTEFRPMIMGIENSGKSITVDFVKNLLLQDVIFDVGTGNNECALAAKKKFKKKNKKVRCFQCGGPHVKKDCPEKQGTSKEKEKVFIASFLADHRFDSTWFIDSGATAHMTNQREFILNERKPVKSDVIVASGQNVKIDRLCVVMFLIFLTMLILRSL